MRLLKGWKLSLMASMALAGSSGHLLAQTPGSINPNLFAPNGLQAQPTSYALQSDALMVSPPEGVPMAGPPMAGPGADYGPGAPGPNCGPMGPGDYGPMGPGGFDPSLAGGAPPCPDCGGPCPGCGGSHSDAYGRNFMNLWLGMRGCIAGITPMLRPYGEGGIANQRWYDVSLEAIGLTRTTGGSNFNVSSLGAGSGNYVLGTDMVAPSTMKGGLAAQVNFQCGPGSNLEVLYFGLDAWNSSASVQSPTSNLYSFISNFGTFPAGGFDDSDRSLQHTLTYQSTLHNGELNLRRRWAEPNGFFQGSFLTGVRYMDLDEASVFSAVGLNNNTAANNGPRFFNYNLQTSNSLVGWQFGGDLWYNFLPGIKFGVELKTGIFNNRAQQGTIITANSLPGTGIPSINEHVLENRTAYITQLSPQAVYRLTYSLAIRSSMQIIWIDNVALASNNFNSAPPSLFVPGSTRIPGIDASTNIVYTGLTLGAEYTW
ncbi:MAG: hypothetical protein WCI02_09885 [Planctomycetota bacterium]